MSPAVEALAPDAPATRWPGVVGIIGIVLSLLTILDKAADLLVALLFTEDDWSDILGASLGRTVSDAIPSAGWMALTSLIWIGLAAVLLTGSIRLRRRLRSGVSLLRLWAWLAIGWFAIDMAVALWWLSGLADQIPAFAGASGKESMILGILMAVVLMLAYPVFLIVWLSQPNVAREHAAWPE